MKEVSSVHTKQIIALLSIILFISGSYYYIGNKDKQASVLIPSHGERAMLSIGDTLLQVEVVGTDASKQLGLSGRESLPWDNGMFFLFSRDDYYGFWMKDMLFPIDIVWVDEDLTIVSITENATPDSFPNIFKPSHVSRYVLEVSEGFTQKYGIKIGDKMDFVDLD